MTADQTRDPWRARFAAALVLLAISLAVSLYLLLSDGDGEGASSTGDGAGSILYVQSGESGTLTPAGKDGGTYKLTLNGVSPKSAYFSDRPARIAGNLDNEAVIDGLFTEYDGDPGDPPNAALALEVGGQDDQVILPVELSRPMFDRRASRLTYLVRPLEEPPDDLAYFSYSEPGSAPVKFRRADIFIDSGHYPDDCQTTLWTRNEPLFLNSAEPAVGSSHYSTLESSVNADSSTNVILVYNGEKGLFGESGGFHADLYYEYPDGTEVHVHPHCNIEGVYPHDTSCTITDPDGTERSCPGREVGYDEDGGNKVMSFSLN